MNKYLLPGFLAATSLIFMLLSCDNSDSSGSAGKDVASRSAFVVPVTVARVEAGDIFPEPADIITNKEAVIPPQCYTKHDEQYNPCMTCHQTYAFGSSPNEMGDGSLQQAYEFSDYGTTNHWHNLFEDKSDRVAAISNQEVIDYIYTDNYSTLIEQLEDSSDWNGPIPKINGLASAGDAFDEFGFAKDDSHWVAFSYKPFPSTFWPTNGSTDDVMLRLPAQFRETSCGSGGYSRDTYIANLAIMEMAIKDLDSVTLPEIDENKVCADLNGDGTLSKVTAINAQDNYVGNAIDVATHTMLYPQGIEFLHTVRYVGVTDSGDIVVPPRMKEVRYMRKTDFYELADLSSRYGNERQEKIDGLLPKYVYRGDKGTNNGFGWQILGFIEAADGHLRLQSEEESLFCMGCHTTIGTTIDQTFSFPRKVTGVDGWGYINLRGMVDAPYAGSSEGEILHYLKTVGGGSEFRNNDEMLAKWFTADGVVDEEKVEAAADVYELITPGVERALKLNKAYMTIVEDQDFIDGRDANVLPPENVHQSIDPETTPTLPVEKTQQWDLRLVWP